MTQIDLILHVAGNYLEKVPNKEEYVGCSDAEWKWYITKNRNNIHTWYTVDRVISAIDDDFTRLESFLEAQGVKVELDPLDMENE